MKSVRARVSKDRELWELDRAQKIKCEKEIIAKGK